MNIQLYSFVTVYCLNFIMFLCVTLKLFSLSFLPLLAPNHGNARGCKQAVTSTIGHLYRQLYAVVIVLWHSVLCRNERSTRRIVVVGCGAWRECEEGVETVYGRRA